MKIIRKNIENIFHNLYYLSATDRNFRIYDRVPDIYLTNNTRLLDFFLRE